MKVTILGRYAPYAAPGGACSGYLVEDDATHILIDAGNGVVSRVQEFVALNDLKAVVVSHLHHDHIADLHGLRYGIRGLKIQGRRQEPLFVYAPDRPEKEFAAISDPGYIEARPISPGEKLIIGPFEIDFCWTAHSLPCLAMRITSSGRTLFYSADSGLSQEVRELARGADLALIESTWPGETPPEGMSGHLTVKQAARLAQEAGANRLLLTHLFPTFDTAQLLREAREVLPLAELAQEKRTYTV